jgi:hypothetical protein
MTFQLLVNSIKFLSSWVRQVHHVYNYYQEVDHSNPRSAAERMTTRIIVITAMIIVIRSDKENMAKRVKKSTNQGQVLESHKDINIEKMKQQHRRRYHPHHRQHRSNLEIVANILELALTEVGNRNKVIQKAITHKASRAYEQLSYYREIMIVKGLLDMDRTE